MSDLSPEQHRVNLNGATTWRGTTKEQSSLDDDARDKSTFRASQNMAAAPPDECSSSPMSSYRLNRFNQLTKRDHTNKNLPRGGMNHERDGMDEDEKKLDDHSSNTILHRNAHGDARPSGYEVGSSFNVPSRDNYNGNGDESNVKDCSSSCSTEPASPSRTTGGGGTRTRRLMRRHKLSPQRFLNHSSSTSTSQLEHIPTLDGKVHPGGDPVHRRVPREDEAHDHGEADVGHSLETKPQHYNLSSEKQNSQTSNGSEDRYYRVCYRGIVALLTEPHTNAERSGTYLGYGEIFSSGWEGHTAAYESENHKTILRAEPALSMMRNDPNTDASQRRTMNILDSRVQLSRGVIDSPPRSVISHHTTGSISSLDTFHTRSTVSQAGSKEQLAQRTTSTPPLSPTESHVSTLLENHVPNQNNDDDPTTFEGLNKAIRVDRILTGGYAMDGLGGLHHTSISGGHNESSAEEVLMHTPKRPSADKSSSALSFLFMRRGTEQIVEMMDHVPQLEEGHFQYRVVSSTPLPIYAGPSVDAPRIKAMALPGTIHDVSLRLRFDDRSTGITREDKNDAQDVWFLRLSHRRGWVLDKKKVRKDMSERWVRVMKEILNSDDGVSVADDVSAVSSVASSSAMTPTAAGARRRHRPPRKRRDAGSVATSKDHHRLEKGVRPLVQPGLSTPVKSTSRSMEQRTMTPSSAVSILSDDSSADRSGHVRNGSVPTSPDFSMTSTIASNASCLETANSSKQFFLIRVTAPRGLKILDTPQFQVNHLIRGKAASSSQHMAGKPPDRSSAASRHSFFHSMSSRLGTVGVVSSKSSSSAGIGPNSNTRVLPCGTLFEASKPMESPGLYSQAAGLIKLSDGSGWAVVPKKEDVAQQYRSYSDAGAKGKEVYSSHDEVGHAIVESLPLLALDSSASRSISRTKWVRVVSRTGVVVSCPPPFPRTDERSPPSSTKESPAASPTNPGQDSDVTSSVASTFVDSLMFRTPKKKGASDSSSAHERNHALASSERHMIASTIPCGMCIEVERYAEERPAEFVRLVGGQGWVPLDSTGKEGCCETFTPDFRFGSFWFRVQSPRGIKVRLGPSRKAPSIRSEDGIHFRFECGEFLRASEVMTVYSTQGKKGKPVESFAKLYRNRHVRLHEGHEEYRSLQSLSAQSEWVQLYGDEEWMLEQCKLDPRIERHKQGWRYKVVADEGVSVRRGPSLSAETVGSKLPKGSSIVITERVSPAGERLTWLRMKSGEGWLHDVDDLMKPLLVEQEQSQVNHQGDSTHPTNSTKKAEDITYNAIISRLFPSDAPKADSQLHRIVKGH